MILTILNYNNGKVYQINNLPKHILNCSETLETYLVENDYPIKYCDYMVSEYEEIIEINHLD